jgi:N-acetylglucosaminyl-diphospho-decaprenol L-rhamnosyltransferase
MAVPSESITTPNLLVIIVNFQTPDLTLQCVFTLADEIRNGLCANIVIVDNHSQDDSTAKIRRSIEIERWQQWCWLVAAEKNLGFAGGNNFGIRSFYEAFGFHEKSKPDFILLLNSDTIVHPGCIKKCLATMDSDETLGAMSCKLVSVDGSIQKVARRYMSPLRLALGATGLPWKYPKWFGWAQLEYPEWDMQSVSGYAEWISGAFMMLRSKVINQIGLLDEDFFFYGEDAEYCFRIRKFGWKIFYEPSVSITHIGGASSDPSRLLSVARSKAVWRARYLFLRKCYGWWSMWFVRCIDIAVIGLRRIKLGVTLQGDSIRAQELKLSHRTILGKLGPF